MQTVLRKMGNSTGIILPKSLLGELGMTTGQAMDLRVEDGRIVATPLKSHGRDGWAASAQTIADEADSEADAWLEVPHQEDDALTW